MISYNRGCVPRRDNTTVSYTEAEVRMKIKLSPIVRMEQCGLKAMGWRREWSATLLFGFAIRGDSGPLTTCNTGPIQLFLEAATRPITLTQ